MPKEFWQNSLNWEAFRINMSNLPLDGIVVIDCGQVIAGPTLAMILGDFGATVLKIENPIGGDQVRAFGKIANGESLHSKLISRNKKSITINLREVQGQELLKRLIIESKADVLIESFRPGTLEKWNLSFDDLKSLSPGLILARVSGFGQDGPYKNRPGFGTLAEAMSGFADVTGEADGPPTLPPFALADNVAALYGAIGVLAALRERDTSENFEGQVVDISLLESLTAILGIYFVEYDQLGIIPKRQGNRTASAPRNTYKTKDGKWIAIAGSTQSITERLFNVMGRKDLLENTKFATNRERVKNVEEMDLLVGNWVSSFNQEEIVKILISSEVAVGPIMNVEDLIIDPQIIFRKSLNKIPDIELKSILMPNPQPKLSRTPGKISQAGPRLGQHTDEVLIQYLKLSNSEIEELRRDSII
jgi:formyl-CoA transferase